MTSSQYPLLARPVSDRSRHGERDNGVHLGFCRDACLARYAHLQARSAARLGRRPPRSPPIPATRGAPRPRRPSRRLAGLDVEDVQVTARRGRVQVRIGKGDAYREVLLNSVCRTALTEWMAARTVQLATSGGRADPAALWLSRAGGRMTARAVDLVIRRLAEDAELSLSAPRCGTPR